MLTDRMQLFLAGVVALLPLLAVAAWLWRRYYRDDEDNAVRRVLKNSSLPIAANLLNRLIDLGFAAITLRLLGAEGNGSYGFVALLVGVYFLTITNWGLNDLAVREIAAGRERPERLFSLTLLLRWGVAAGLLPVGLLLGAGYAALGTPLGVAEQWACIILLLHLFPAALAAACSASFQAAQRMEVPALVLVLTNIAKVLLGVVALLAVDQVGERVVALAIVALAATTINGLLFWWLQQRLLFRTIFFWHWPTGRTLLREAFPLLLNSLLLIVFFRFDYIILRGTGDLAALGSYDAAYKLINMTQIVPPYFVAALFPLLARYAVDDRSALLRAYYQALKLLQWLAWPAAVVCTLFAADLIWLLAGPGFEAGAVALAILIWYLPLSYANGVTQYVLIALRRQQAITQAFLLAAGFNLGLNLLLIPQFGITAAAALTVASEVVLLLPLLYALRREAISVPLLSLSWQPIVASLIMGFTVWLVIPVGWLPALLLAPLVYFGVLWLCKAFGVEEQRLFRRVLGRVAK
jgi:O-antigen/teichoic acid export membrane protein